MPSRIRLNAFAMNAVGHQSPGLWRHPEDRSTRYTDLSYWTDLARLLERGVFDGVFFADVLGGYDLYGGDAAPALRAAAQVPINDPLLLVPAMAAVTRHLGFGVTANTSAEHPFPFARRMSTLDHLTQGRVGWNVVTGYLGSAFANLGTVPLAHDERYDHADEYLQVVRKLWDQSWEDGAVVRDRESGVHTDPAKVHPVAHRGRWFDVPGFHLSEPSPQRTPVIYQAGASPRGLAFAARHAEAVFVAAAGPAALAGTVDRVRGALVDAGRAPDAARVYTKATVVAGDTTAHAWERYDEMRSYADVDGALALVSGWVGQDLARYGLDDPVEALPGGVHTYAASFTGARDDGRAWTVRDLGERAAIGGLGSVFVGSPADVADQMEALVDATGVDGFNLAYVISPGTFEEVVDRVVPELQRRGRYPTAYEPGTLRRKLLGHEERLPVP